MTFAICLMRDGGRDAGIHASAQEHDSANLRVSHCRLSIIARCAAAREWACGVAGAPLHALSSRMPNELVQLQAEPHRQFVSQNPFHQSLRAQALPFAFGVIEHWGEKHGMDALVQLMLAS